MIRVHLDRVGLVDVRSRLQKLLSRLRQVDDDAAAAQILYDSLPDGVGLWKVPNEAADLLKRYLTDIPSVSSAVKLAKIAEHTESVAYLKRLQRGREKFNEWVGADHPDILATLWHNLSHDDRHYWLMLADDELAGEAG